MADINPAEIAIIGGSNAGLSAALTLGRACRKVIVIDDGNPRNASARYAYGMYTRDKTSPADLTRIGREQLAPYDVEFCDGHANTVEKKENGFLLTLKDGRTVTAKKLILATGVADDLTFLPGLTDIWGTRAFSCPYCDGWEMRDKTLAVIGSGEKGCEFALTIQN